MGLVFSPGHRIECFGFPCDHQLRFLVDRLGNERTALEWLEKEKGVDSKTKIRDWKLKPRFGDLSFLHMAAIATLNALGFNALAQQIEAAAVLQSLDRLNLDGLLALWHPPLNK